MKKYITIIALLLLIAGCASIGYNGLSNEADIEKITMPDSSNVYLIQWKGHIFIYDKNSYPTITEIEYIK
jgi:PBP1b-binding outer membrane lipoprotein LpoB